MAASLPYQQPRHTITLGVQGSGTAAQREAAEVIAARSNEVARSQNGGKKYYGY